MPTPDGPVRGQRWCRASFSGGAGGLATGSDRDIPVCPAIVGAVALACAGRLMATSGPEAVAISAVTTAARRMLRRCADNSGMTRWPAGQPASRTATRDWKRHGQSPRPESYSKVTDIDQIPPYITPSHTGAPSGQSPSVSHELTRKLSIESPLPG
jgi:hypothetical protein